MDNDDDQTPPPYIHFGIGPSPEQQQAAEAAVETERLSFMQLIDELNNEQLQTIDIALTRIFTSGPGAGTMAALFSGMIEREKYHRSNPLNNSNKTLDD